MNAHRRLCVKLIHCGNVNIAHPQDKEEKNIFFMPTVDAAGFNLHWANQSVPVPDTAALIEISPETVNMELRRKNKDRRLYFTNNQLEELLDYVKEMESVKIQLFFFYPGKYNMDINVRNFRDYVRHLQANYVEVDFDLDG